VSPIRIEEIHERLEAFYPVYTEQGSMTEIVYADAKTGEECIGIDSRQMRSILSALARCYAIDLHAQADLLRKRYRHKRMYHFHLGGRVFIPFKLRKPQFKDDASYGFVNVNSIERLICDDPPAVLLRTGKTLPLLCHMDTARNAYYLGLEIQAGLGYPGNQDLDNVVAILQGLLKSPRTVSPPRKRVVPVNKTKGKK